MVGTKLVTDYSRYRHPKKVIGLLFPSILRFKNLENHLMKKLWLVTMFIFSSTNALAAIRPEDNELESILNETKTTFTEAVSSEDPKTPPADTYVAPLHFKTLMGKIDIWKKPSAKFPKRNTTDYCMAKVHTYQCEHSDFKDLGFMERYNKLEASINARLANPETSRGLEEQKNAVACIMSRETGVLEPITVSYANCMPGLFATDLGLGQVTLHTFLHIVGLSNNEITKVVSHYFGKPGYKKKKLILSDERANALPVITQVAPFNTLEYRKNPMRMYEEMADSYEFQIDMTLNVLKSKKAISQNDNYLDQLRKNIENPKLTPKQKLAAEKKLKATIAWYQQKTYENYNGSDTKVKYGAAVYACKACLDEGKKETAHCLGLAMGTKNLEDFTVCKK